MSGQKLESLKAFQTWFFSPAGPGIGRIPLCEPTHQKDGITALTLYRRNGYQAELALISPGQDYEICLPEGMELGFVFLGGSFHYSDNPGTRPTTSYDYQEEINAVMVAPDYLERPHPLRNREQHPPFSGLPQKHRIVFQATGQTGIVLLLGLYETDKAYSFLDYVRPLPPIPSSAETAP